MHDDKRKLRNLKRTLKRAGSKHRRRDFKQHIRDNPAQAHEAEENFGRYSSETLNGLDQDTTRRNDPDDQ